MEGPDGRLSVPQWRERVSQQWRATGQPAVAISWSFATDCSTISGTTGQSGRRARSSGVMFVQSKEVGSGGDGD